MPNFFFLGQKKVPKWGNCVVGELLCTFFCVFLSWNLAIGIINADFVRSTNNKILRRVVSCYRWSLQSDTTDTIAFATVDLIWRNVFCSWVCSVSNKIHDKKNTQLNHELLRAKHSSCGPRNLNQKSIFLVEQPTVAVICIFCYQYHSFSVATAKILCFGV